MRAAKCSPFLWMVMALLALIVGGAQAFASAGESETEVTVSFIEWIYFETLESGGMDVDFGAQPLPLHDTVIPAPDGGHTLRVCDGRLQAGKWTVTAVMSPMQGGNESFDAQIRIYNIAPVEGITFHLEGGPTGQYARVSQDQTTVMEAESGLAWGVYDLTSGAGDVRLFIDGGEAQRVKPRAYKGTITWTLATAP